MNGKMTRTLREEADRLFGKPRIGTDANGTRYGDTRRKYRRDYVRKRNHELYWTPERLEAKEREREANAARIEEGKNRRQHDAPTQANPQASARPAANKPGNDHN